VRKLIVDCVWNHLSDVTAKSFELWRQKMAAELSIKTRNEYRAAIYSLLAWLESDNEQIINPLKRVKKINGRGLEKVKRRAATPAEMNGLLSKAGIYAVAYLAAGTTGLRRGELSKLEVGDLHLDAEPPVAMVRAATTKNRKPAIVYLGRQLVVELKKLQTLGLLPNGRVLAGRIPTMKQMREHLAAAGIEYKDGQERRLDFHALRKTFGTNLGIAGASDAERMKLMRLKSYRLMTENYNDSEKVLVSELVAKLPEFGCLENGKPYTEKHTQKLVQEGQSVSKPVTSPSDLNCDKAPVNKGESHSLSLLGIPSLKESNGGERGIRTPDTTPRFKYTFLFAF
jgi:integrase